MVMVPAGLLSGRLRSSDGSPLISTAVSAYQMSYREGGRAILQARNSSVTDDRGEFRLYWLPAGEYFVGVEPRSSANTRTYYPGVIDPATAQKIVLKEGQQIADLNFDIKAAGLMKISGRVLTSIVTGTILNPTSPPAIYLVPRDPTKFVDSSPPGIQNVAADRSNGQFEIRNVPAGSYELITSIRDSNIRSIPGRALVNVGAGDVQNVVVNIHPGVSVKARIVFTGGLLPANLSAVRLQMQPLESYPAPFEVGTTSGGVARAASTTTDYTIAESSKVSELPLVGNNVMNLLSVLGNPPPVAALTDETGATIFQNVAEARYTFTVTGLPPNAFVSDIRMGNVSIFDDGLQVGPTSPEEIQVMVQLTDNAVAGTVVNGSQQPAALSKVVLVPEQARRGNTALYRMSYTNMSGQFTFHGVPAGNYKVFAWVTTPIHNAWQNETFIARFEELGKAVTVPASGLSDVKVQVIP
jgi:hypothetical protein